MKAFKALLKTEIKLSLRGMDMLIFAICMPLVVVVIIGAVFAGRTVPDGGQIMLAQSFGAVASIAICAGGVMGLPLVLSDYRGKKILKRFRVTPTSPAMLLGVQLAIYALYSLASLVLVYVVSVVFFGFRLQGTWLQFMGAYLLVMVSMFSIGVLVGGLAPNVKVAGAVASLLYFPMIVFSGATLPYEVMPALLQKIADVMPLTQGIKLLKAASLGLPMSGVMLSAIVMVVVAVACSFVALRWFKWE